MQAGAASGHRGERGLLVLLASAQARGDDLLIAAARRRYAGDSRLEFPIRLQTRESELDSAHIGVPRRVFRDIERNQGFAVSWQNDDARHGLTNGALEALEAGRIVVVAVPPAAVETFKALWPNVEVVPFGSEIDAVRPSGRRQPPAPGQTSVRHAGDIAEAVRRFHRVLDHIALRQFGQTHA